jgi:hypothetical protein
MPGRALLLLLGCSKLVTFLAVRMVCMAIAVLAGEDPSPRHSKSDCDRVNIYSAWRLLKALLAWGFQ